MSYPLPSSLDRVDFHAPGVIVDIVATRQVGKPPAQVGVCADRRGRTTRAAASADELTDCAEVTNASSTRVCYSLSRRV